MTPMKRRMLMDVGTFDSIDKSLETEINIEHANDYDEHKVLKRPQGSHATKNELKNHAMKEFVLKTLAKTTTNMATATLKKV
jgi:hypothetical protein